MNLLSYNLFVLRVNHFYINDMKRKLRPLYVYTFDESDKKKSNSGGKKLYSCYKNICFSRWKVIEFFPPIFAERIPTYEYVRYHIQSISFQFSPHPGKPLRISCFICFGYFFNDFIFNLKMMELWRSLDRPWGVWVINVRLNGR